MKKGQPAQTSPIPKTETNNTPLCPRLERLALALLEGAQTSRDLIERVPANNVPAYIARLRTKYGLTIPCVSEPFTTCDGLKSSFGRYHLTKDDRRVIRSLLRSTGQ